MSDDSNGDATILVVDDEKEVADAYSFRLRTKYDVRTAYGGEDALEKVDEDVDVILLDRRMPDINGDGVLDNVRARGLQCRVIMVTAVDPDFDILEMDFDDYLNKPVDKESLFAAIEQQLQSREYNANLTDYFGVAAKLAVLESEKTQTELANSEEYQELKAQETALQDDMDEALDDFDDVDHAFRGLNRSAGS